jgi:hypothetical protein
MMTRRVVTDENRTALPLPNRIEIHSSQKLAAGVSKRWRRQYGETPKNPRFAEILRQLDALGDEATPEQIEQIIGNKSWTREYCNLCDSEVSVWVRLGDEPDYESATVEVCPSCLRAALFVLEAAGV